MESLGTAVLELVADTKPLVAGLEKGKLESEKFASTTATGLTRGVKAAAVGAGIAVAGLAIGLKKSFDAAEANQVAQAKLATAFKAAGLDVNKYKDEIDSAEQSSAGLGFKSEDVKASLAKLVVATHDGTKAIALLSTAQDLARFKGISLTDASTILTSAMAGSSRAARQLGIAVTSSKDASNQASLAYADQKRAIEASFGPTSKLTDAQKAQKQAELDALQTKFVHIKAQAALDDKMKTSATVIQAVNDKLHGQADAFSKTAQGAKEKMGAEFQLLEINIGNVLIPVITKVSQVLAQFSEFLVKHATIVKIVIAVIGPLALGILAYVAAAKMAAAAQILWNGVMDANPIGVIIIAIAALVIAIVELWKHSQTFRDIVLGVWKDVTDATSTFTSFFTTTVPDAFKAVIDWLTNTWHKVTDLVSAPFTDLVKSVTSGFGIPDLIKTAFGHTIDWFTNTFNAVKGLLTKPFSDAWDYIKDVPGNVTDGFGKIKTWFDNAVGWAIKTLITQPFSDAWDFIKGLPDKITSAFGTVEKGLGKALAGAGNVIKKLLTAPINGVIGLIDSIEIPKVHINMPWPIPDINFGPYGPFFHIPYLAKGGIVHSPTLAMIGEAGPEAVVPLSGGGPGLGGGITVNVSGVVGNEREVAITIGRELQKLKTRGLGFGLS